MHAITLGALLVLSKNATLTLLHHEEEKKDAVCLDGSAPGYFMRPGTGEGAKKWILHLMGGGWCEGAACYNRSLTQLGSTKYWPQSLSLGGFLSDDPNVNPDFYNWNVVYFIYCDGASFSGDNDEPDSSYGSKLYYRGHRILLAIMIDLSRNKGMDSSATDVILTGCSAGGLAVYLHSLFVRTLIFPTTKYKAFADAGYIIDIPDVYGSTDSIVELRSMLKAQQSAKHFSFECANVYKTEEDSYKCFLPPYNYRFVTSPLFVLNSLYDTAQLSGLYHLPCLPGNCSAKMMEKFQHFHEVFVEKIQPVLSSLPPNGFFFDSCLVHCQTLSDEMWTTFRAKGRLMRDSFADWYYERPGSENIMDCEYPCNHSCP